MMWERSCEEEKYRTRLPKKSLNPSWISCPS